MKTLGQKIAIVTAVLSYLAAVACVVIVIVREDAGQMDPVKASLLASVVFFVGVGYVLQVIGTARLKGILSRPGSGDAGGE